MLECFKQDNTKKKKSLISLVINIERALFKEQRLFRVREMLGKAPTTCSWETKGRSNNQDMSMKEINCGRKGSRKSRVSLLEGDMRMTVWTTSERSFLGEDAVNPHGISPQRAGCVRRKIWIKSTGRATDWGGRWAWKSWEDPGPTECKGVERSKGLQGV